MENTENPIDFVSVTDKTADGKKKIMKIFIIAVVAVLVIVIAVALAVKNKNKSANDVHEDVTSPRSDAVYEPVKSEDDVDVSFGGDVSADYADEVESYQFESAMTTAYKPEATTVTSVAPSTEKKEQETVTAYLEKTTVITETTTSADSSALAKINSFFAGKYYFDGYMITDDSRTPTEMAMNGGDFQVYTEMDGLDLAVLNLDGKMYLLNPDTKNYAEITSSLKKMIGLDDDAFTYEFTKLKFDGNSPTSVTEAEYNGQSAVCYTYKDSENYVEFIVVGDDIKQVIQSSSSSGSETVIEADEFSTEIPDDMISLKGYSKINIISFIKDFI